METKCYVMEINDKVNVRYYGEEMFGKKEDKCLLEPFQHPKKEA
jgi:hypothetical protein